MKLNKKAQIVANLQGFVMGIVTIAVILAIGLFILGQFRTTIIGTTAGDVTTTPSQTFLLNSSSPSSITASALETVTITGVTATTQFTTTVNQTGGSWDLSGSAPKFYLRLKGSMPSVLDNTTMIIKNGSIVLTSGNYTIYNAPDGETGIVNFTTGGAAYMNDNITIIYNRTFALGEDITGTKVCYIVSDCLTNVTGANTAGTTHYIQLKTGTSGTSSTVLNTGSLDARNYTVKYNLVTSTPGAGETAASNATLAMITQLGQAPTWIGLLIVVVFSVAILSYFYFKQN